MSLLSTGSDCQVGNKEFELYGCDGGFQSCIQPIPDAILSMEFTVFTSPVAAGSRQIRSTDVLKRS